MSHDRAQIGEAANSENDWVPARILKQDAPPEGSLLKIAERARGRQISGQATLRLRGLAAKPGLHCDAIETILQWRMSTFASAYGPKGE
jgi:hypothetical protein